MVRVGEGRYTYEIDDDWAKLPEGWEMGMAHAAVDAKGLVYVFNRGDHPVMVFDREGNFQNEWSTEGLIDGHGITITPEQEVFLTMRRPHQVAKYTMDGRPLMTLGNWGVPSDNGGTRPDGTVVRATGPFNLCTGVALGPSGDIFVSDGYGNCRVHKFAPDGRYLYSWGRPGKVGPGNFHIPHGIAVHADGRVFVCDRQNNRVQIFTPDGNFITQWTDLKRPSDICIDEDEVAYVTEQDAFLSILDLDGRLIEQIEPGPSYNIGHAICCDSHGDLYIGQNLDDYRLLKLVRQS